jgi:hypothetical protein
MVEPVTPAAGAVVTSGLMVLFVGWFGAVGADVLMVVLAALAGCSVALSAERRSFVDSLRFIVVGVLVSLVTSWTVASGVAALIPAVSGPSLPSSIALVIGYAGKRIADVLAGLVTRAEKASTGVKQ